MYKILSANKHTLTFLSYVSPLALLPLSFALDKTSSKILTICGESGQACLVSDLRGST